MTKTKKISAGSETRRRRKAPRPALPLPVQILSVLVYGGFAITAVVIALIEFWPAGVALAALLGWRGHFLPIRGGSLEEALDDFAPEAPEVPARSSGNASFDAYRSRMMERLEQEQTAFEGFLTRLRDAKDKVEFDRFLDDRAARARKEWDSAEA